MTEKFDPYYQWLGIAATDRPIHHYSLLGLKPFETDAVVIRVAADRQMAHLRTFQNGPHAVESQQLLNEIAQARICLLDTVRKTAYDAQLRSQLGMVDDGHNPAGRVKITLEHADSTRDPVRLYRPGRGPRDQGVDRRIVIGAALATVLLVALAAYRVYVRLQPVTIAERTVDLTQTPDRAKPSVPPVVPHDPPESAVTPDASVDRQPGATSDPPSPTANELPTTANSASPDPPQAAPGTAATTDAETVPASPSAPDPTVARRDPPRAPRPAQHTSAMPWDDSVLKVAGSPRQFTAGTPAGDLLSSLADRDVMKAKEVLKAWKPATGSPLVSDDIYADGALIVDAVRAFWTAVSDGLAELKTGDRLHCREYVGTVVSVSERELQLEAPTGKIETFDTRPTRMPRDLAIAVAAHRWRSSSSAAWRAIGIFLAIDRDGDMALSQLFSQRAEQNGVDVDFFFQALARLQGESSVPFILQADEPKAPGQPPTSS